MNGEGERMRALLRECGIHARRIRRARDRCAELFPLSEESYRALTEDEVEHIDQLLYRFTKLQDVLGARLFPALMGTLREDADSMTIFDVLAALEGAGAIPSQEEWLRLRELRNRIAHEYEYDARAGSESLNELYTSLDELLRAWEATSRFANEKVLPSLPE